MSELPIPAEAPQRSAPGATAAARELPRAVVAIVGFGIVLNPLNTSMVAVALVTIQDDFSVSLATATWLAAAFYIAGCLGQALMGRLADTLGPRRIFCAGWVVVGLVGALAPLAPTFGWLVAARVVLALGTSAAFPAGLAILRHNIEGTTSRAASNALSVLTMAGFVTAAFGPALGGVLILIGGWQAIFAVNAALAIVGLPLSLALLPRDRIHAGREQVRAYARAIDWPGIVLFVAAITALLELLASVRDPRLWLLPVLLVLGALFIARERRAPVPVINLAVATDRELAKVYLKFATANLVFFSIFFGLPQWLEEVRDQGPGQVGVLMLILCGAGVVATPLTARFVRRVGASLPFLAGALLLLGGSLMLLAFDGDTSLAYVALAAVVLGIPGAVTAFAMQAALYARARARDIGAAGGLFQMSRYVGAMLATSLLAMTCGDRITTAGLHRTALVMIVVSVILAVVELLDGRGRRDMPGPQPG